MRVWTWLGTAGGGGFFIFDLGEDDILPLLFTIITGDGARVLFVVDPFLSGVYSLGCLGVVCTGFAHGSLYGMSALLGSH